MRQPTELIRVNKQTKDILLGLKEHPKDSYDVVINALISKCYNHKPTHNIQDTQTIPEIQKIQPSLSQAPEPLVPRPVPSNLSTNNTFYKSSRD